MESNQSEPVLRREVGLPGAIMMGLGSIIGTGVFVSIAIAAGITGSSVLLAIAIAALVAMCNAFSSAQLAASHPVSGGTYEYGYRYLRPEIGFAAGWMFLCAKSASAATAALGFSGYLVHQLNLAGTAMVPIAVATSAVITLIVLCGIRRSNVTNILIVSITLLALVVFVVAGLPVAVRNGSANWTPFFMDTGSGAAHSFLYATALMFVAYTGYGRIATLGEEVKDPKRTIPKAIVATLLISAVLYMAVGGVAVASIGAVALGETIQGDAAPLEEVARQFDLSGTGWIVSLGAMTAMLGVLLNLILGLSRVLLAMGRRGDMPAVTARLDRTGSTPLIAVIVIGVLVTSLTCIGNVKTTWSFSAFTVLVYYSITNLSAIRMPSSQRLYPVVFAWLGLIACLSLAFQVEWQVWGSGLVLLLFGQVWHWIARSRRQSHS